MFYGLRCYSAFSNGFVKHSSLTNIRKQLCGFQLRRDLVLRQHVPRVLFDNSLDFSYSWENTVLSFFRHFSSFHQIDGMAKRRTSWNVYSPSTRRTFLQTEITILNYRKLNDDAHTNDNNVPGVSNASQKSTESPGKTVLLEEAFTKATLEKKIIYLMDIGEFDEAINVLKESVANGTDPDRTVVLDILWQIADLGKVDYLLDLYETFLKESGLFSSKTFYKCLGLAVLSSGYVEKGIDLLVQGYETGMSPGDIDVLFTVLATKIIKEYDDHLPSVERFVDTVLATEPPLLPARAMLWKCYVLAGRFDQADELRLKHELKKLVRAQAASIIQSSPPSSRYEFDREAVLHWLIQQSYLPEGLRSSALHLLVQLKSDENEWRQVIKYITVAADNDVKPQRDTLVNFLSRFFDECSSEDELAFWKIVGDNLETNEIKLEMDDEKKSDE